MFTIRQLSCPSNIFALWQPPCSKTFDATLGLEAFPFISLCCLTQPIAAMCLKHLITSSSHHAPNQCVKVIDFVNSSNQMDDMLTKSLKRFCFDDICNKLHSW